MFHYMQMAKGARVDMKSGEWNKSLIEAELAEHPLINSTHRNSNNSAAELHECDTTYRCIA